jgi:hypothetical protein
MAYTEEDLAAVRAAMARPESYVAFSDRAVTYRSLADLQELEREILKDLAKTAGTPRPRQTLIVGSKGF